VVLALVVIAATIVALVGPSSTDDAGEDTDAGPVDEPMVPVPPAEATDADPDEGFTIGAPPGPYRIDYRVEDPTGTLPPSLDQVAVDLPFRSRLEIHPPGGGSPAVQIGTIDRLLVLEGGSTAAQPVTVARVPALAPAATRVGPVLDDAVAAGLLELRGQRIVADRRCQVLRSAELLEAGPLRPLTPERHVDTCIDREGLVLEEITTIDGAPSLVRTAVRVEVPAELDPMLFETGPVSAPPDQGGGATTPAEPGTAPEGPVFDLPDAAVPDGFERVGRYSVVPPQPERFADPARRDAVIAGIADVWAGSDGDVLVVYQGHTLGGVDAFPAVDFAQPVTSTLLGPGEQLLSTLGTELRFDRPEGRFVHVFGTLAPAALLAVADALVEGAGTGLELIDE